MNDALHGITTLVRDVIAEMDTTDMSAKLAE
jgi:hypothetical protein